MARILICSNVQYGATNLATTERDQGNDATPIQDGIKGAILAP
jgi:hypothetical protein